MPSGLPPVRAGDEALVVQAHLVATDDERQIGPGAPGAGADGEVDAVAGEVAAGVGLLTPGAHVLEDGSDAEPVPGERRAQPCAVCDEVDVSLGGDAVSPGVELVAGAKLHLGDEGGLLRGGARRGEEGQRGQGSEEDEA